MNGRFDDRDVNVADADSHRDDGGHRDFMLVWIGQLISGVGSRLTSFALGFWVYETTGSMTRYAMIFAAMAVPALLLAPFAGVMVDRWDRRRTMIVCEVVCAIIVTVLAVLIAKDALAMWHIYLAVAMIAVASAFLQPAYGASVPLLVRQEQLVRMNGLIQTGQGFALVAGPTLANLITSRAGIWMALVIDALTFVFGALCLMLARVPRPSRDSNAAIGLWQEASEGWRYIVQHRGLFGLLMVYGFNNFFFGIASIIIFPLVYIVGSPELVGLQMSIGCSGLILGGLLMGVWGGPRNRIHGVLGFSMLCGLGMVAHGLSPSFTLLAVAGFFTFMAISAINTTNAALWQSRVPSGLLGRCFSIQRVMTEAAMPIGYLLAGPIAERFFEPAMMPGGMLAGTIGTLIGSGPGRGYALMFILLGLAMIIVAMAGYLSKAIRETDRSQFDEHGQSLAMSR